MFLGEPQNIYLVLRVSPKGAGLVHWDPAVPPQKIEKLGNTLSVMRVIPHATEFGLVPVPSISGNCIRHTARALIAKDVLARVRDMGGPSTVEELAVRNKHLFQSLFNGGALDSNKKKDDEQSDNNGTDAESDTAGAANGKNGGGKKNNGQTQNGRGRGNQNDRVKLAKLYHPDAITAILGGSCANNIFQGALCCRPLYPLTVETKEWDWDALEAGRAAGLINRPLPAVLPGLGETVAKAGYARGDEYKRFRGNELDDGEKSSGLPYETEYIIPGTVLVGVVAADSAVPLAAAFMARFAELLKKEPYIGAKRATGYGLVDVLGCYAYNGVSASAIDSSLYDRAADAAARAVLEIVAA